jgi:hypothetical protein
MLQAYGLPRPVTGVALRFTSHISMFLIGYADITVGQVKLNSSS